MDLIGEIGGVMSTFQIIFGVFMNRYSEFVFTFNAIQNFFKVKTKDTIF